ncbi:hypothetical protein BE17_42665 [Sorangium cellulosum]|uniref:Uncharacterized protein n=1 Tax=Sorangium cellulosum TaxID=56 RepID=A0A150RBI0_SORCE|nr:hypothetical protein BE17_42665 [Sorangium cellulosum]
MKSVSKKLLSIDTGSRRVWHALPVRSVVSIASWMARIVFEVAEFADIIVDLGARSYLAGSLTAVRFNPVIQESAASRPEALEAKARTVWITPRALPAS